MSWDAIVAHRRWLTKVGAACLVAGALLGIAGFFVPGISLAPAIFALLGVQAFGALPLLQRIADLQAVMDMRKMHEDTATPDGLIVIRPGEIHEFAQPMGGGPRPIRLRAHTTSKLEVMP